MGTNNKTKQECAVKFFKNYKKNIEKFLFEEAILKKLNGLVSFPSLLFSSQKNLIIVETLHGPNIKQLFEFCGYKFPIRTICSIGIELVSRLEEIHSIGIVHRDIKPSNFAWGKFSDNCNELKDHILLIDYDLAGLYKNEKNEHILFQHDETIVGNLTYKSLNGTNNISQTRRDDMESLFYCLLFLYNGDLPWNKKNVNLVYNKINRKILRKSEYKEEDNDLLIPKNQIIYEFKKRIPVKSLCEGLPTEFEVLLLYIRNLQFDESPNYGLIKDLLKRIIINNTNNCEEGEYKYIWELKFANILKKPYKIKNKEMMEIKNKLFKGYDIEIETFIKSLKKFNLISLQSLNK